MSRNGAKRPKSRIAESNAPRDLQPGLRPRQAALHAPEQATWRSASASAALPAYSGTRSIGFALDLDGDHRSTVFTPPPRQAPRSYFAQVL